MYYLKNIQKRDITQTTQTLHKEWYLCIGGDSKTVQNLIKKHNSEKHIKPYQGKSFEEINFRDPNSVLINRLVFKDVTGVYDIDRPGEDLTKVSVKEKLVYYVNKFKEQYQSSLKSKYVNSFTNDYTTALKLLTLYKLYKQNHLNFQHVQSRCLQGQNFIQLCERTLNREYVKKNPQGFHLPGYTKEDRCSGVCIIEIPRSKYGKFIKPRSVKLHTLTRGMYVYPGYVVPGYIGNHQLIKQDENLYYSSDKFTELVKTVDSEGKAVFKDKNGNKVSTSKKPNVDREQSNVIVDDGFGNLVFDGWDGPLTRDKEIVGHVVYETGLIIINRADIQLITPPPVSSQGIQEGFLSILSWNSTSDLDTLSINCRVSPQDFTRTNNPTHTKTHQPLFVSSLGIYNLTGDLILYGKLNSPVKKLKSTEMTFNLSLHL